MNANFAALLQEQMRAQMSSFQDLLSNRFGGNQQEQTRTTPLPLPTVETEELLEEENDSPKQDPPRSEQARQPSYGSEAYPSVPRIHLVSPDLPGRPLSRIASLPPIHQPQRHVRIAPETPQRHFPEALEETRSFPQRPFTRITEKIDPLDDATNPTFRQWRISIRDRLTLNGDHYGTEAKRMALIWSNCTGSARSYLEPRYQSDNISRNFASANEMIELLETYFTTGYEAEDNKNAFDDLRI